MEGQRVFFHNNCELKQIRRYWCVPLMNVYGPPICKGRYRTSKSDLYFWGVILPFWCHVHPCIWVDLRCSLKGHTKSYVDISLKVIGNKTYHPPKRELSSCQNISSNAKIRLMFCHLHPPRWKGVKVCKT